MTPNIDPKETFEIEVIDRINHKDADCVDLFLRQPEAWEFAPSNGIGVPASLPHETLAHFKSSLSDLTGQEYLTPHQGYAGPDYAAPSADFLKTLQHKAKIFLDTHDNQMIQKNAARLDHILNNPELLEKLQANYSVLDLVDLFPKILSVQDILTHQPLENGNKTYTVDGRPQVIRNGVKCFRINVKHEICPTYRGLFNEETPAGTKLGQSSHYLHSLKIRDFVTINAALKPGPQMPQFKDHQRDIVIITQGNALIRMLSILEDVKQRKQNGEKFGTISLIAAFRTHQHVLELEALKPYLEDKTLDALHLCLSRETQEIIYALPTITAHLGQRVQAIFENTAFSKLEKPFLLVGGGQDFIEGPQSVTKFLADKFGYDYDEILGHKQTHHDMRVSNSPNRKPKLQGVKY